MTTTTSDEFDWAAYRDERIGNFALDRLPPTLELPALPQAVTAFVEESNAPEPDMRRLASILETDAGLSVELLRFVSSSAMGMKSRCTSVRHALTLLGLKRGRQFVLTTGMKAAVHARKSKLIHQQTFWAESLQKAIFAKLVARLLGADEELAFSGALLQDFLLPILTNEFSDEYVAFFDPNRTDATPLDQFEEQRFGWTHTLAGAALASRWKLPEELVCCLVAHHDGLTVLADLNLRRSPLAAVALSSLLPDSSRQNKIGLQQLAALSEKWKSFSLTELAAETDRLQEELSIGIGNPSPLVARVASVVESVPA